MENDVVDVGCGYVVRTKYSVHKPVNIGVVGLEVGVDGFNKFISGVEDCGKRIRYCNCVG